MGFASRNSMKSVTESLKLSRSSGLISIRKSEATLPWNGPVVKKVDMKKTTQKSRSFFLWVAITSLLCRNQQKQFTIIRVTGQLLEMGMIFMSVIKQILRAIATRTSAAATTTRNTSAMTRHHGRDSMGVQQDLTNLIQKSGKCGRWNGHEFKRIKLQMIRMICNFYLFSMF